MPDLLSNLYKLMDDIYDNVRRAAYGTTKMYLQVNTCLLHMKYIVNFLHLLLVTINHKSEIRN